MNCMCAISGCRKHSDRRLGRRNFCSDHYKEVKRAGGKGTRRRPVYILAARVVDPSRSGLPNFPFQIYQDTFLRIQ